MSKLPSQEWCSCCNGYPIHHVVEYTGETKTLKCSKCGKKHTTATEAYLRALDEEED